MIKPSTVIARSAPVLGVIALLSVCQVASAQNGIDLESSLAPAVTAICDTIRGIQSSTFLSIIALVMFVSGLAMMWLKVRGGMGLAITGFVGYFLIKQSLQIATTLTIVDAAKCPSA